MLAAAYGLGFALRGQRIQSTLLAQRAERLEREREQKARLAVAEERVRIARELHDIVAHAISVDRGAGAGGAARARGRAGVGARGARLDRDDRPAGARRDAPTPGGTPEGGPRARARPATEPRVISTTSPSACAKAGLPVELHVEGEAEPLPPGVDLSAYRIVQEALTNALKHAGPASAQVVVRYRPEEVELEITDDGRGAVDGSVDGHGLVGMRERAALVGGSVESGTNGGRGYTVRARLPA